MDCATVPVKGDASPAHLWHRDRESGEACVTGDLEQMYEDEGEGWGFPRGQLEDLLEC